MKILKPVLVLSLLLPSVALAEATPSTVGEIDKTVLAEPSALTLKGILGYTTSTMEFRDSGNSSQGYSFGNVSQFSGGLGVEYQTSPLVAISADLLYQEKGFSLSFLNASADFILPYVVLPVLVRVYPASVFSLGAGAYAAYQIGNARFETQNVEADGEAAINRFDYGAVANIGLKFPTGNGVAILGDLRYSHGLANLSKDPEVEAYNRSLEASVGVGF